MNRKNSGAFSIFFELENVVTVQIYHGADVFFYPQTLTALSNEMSKCKGLGEKKKKLVQPLLVVKA